MRYLILFLSMTTFLLGSLDAIAARIEIVPDGSGAFGVNGSAMDGVSGIQFDITYPLDLGTATVTKGTLVGNAIIAANTQTIGHIKVAIISTTIFSGSGTVASIKFANPSGKGGPTITSYNMINSRGASVPAETPSTTDAENGLINNAGLPFSNTPSQQTSDNTVKNQTSSVTPSTTSTPGTAKNQESSLTSSISTLGTVTMPVENVPVPAQKTVAAEAENPTPVEEPVKSSDTTVQETAASAKQTAEDKTEEPKQTSYSSVLDRFKQYKGEMSPAIMTALFSKPVATNVTQNPEIAMSNGKESVTITFTLSDNKTSAPNFALTGAKMLNLTNEKENGTKWILEILPQKNSVSASVTMIAGNEIIDYPLTLVPLAKEITDKETDFAIFLKDTGIKTPRRDLNGDGAHDYLDNYIYTAYYLILQQNKEKIPSSNKKDVEPAKKRSTKKK